MKYEIHDKEPEFKPFSVMLTFENMDEAEDFEAYACSCDRDCGLWEDLRKSLAGRPPRNAQRMSAKSKKK